MDPLIASALLRTGGSLLGSVLGGSSGSRKRAAAHRERLEIERADRHIAEERARADSYLQRTVADAKAAGLHPLFALGGGAGGGGSIPDPYTPTSIYEPPDSGSTVGDVFQTLASGASGYFESKAERDARVADEQRQKRLDDATIRAAEARAARDEAEALLATSAAAKATQESNHARPGDGVTITPLSEPVPLHKRPLLNLPNESHPKYVTVPGDYYPYAPPSLGGDEINQVIWLLNRAIDQVGEVWYPGSGQGIPQAPNIRR